MEEKKIIIMDGKEFETYSPLTSQIIECASYADRIGNADSLGLVTKYFKFLIKWKWAIIVFMPFALLMNGGIICDIVLGIVLIISYIWGNYYSECSKILIQLNFLGASSYSWDSFEAANNTLKEADYLIPKLKECEKQTEETKRWKMYLELVEEMDEKYGERKHMLGRPYSKEQHKVDKENTEVEDARKEARENACQDVITFLNNVKELYNKVWEKNEKSLVEAQLELFELDHYLSGYHDKNALKMEQDHYYNFLNRPSKSIFDAYENTYKDIYDTIVGRSYLACDHFNEWGLSELIHLNMKRLFVDNDVNYPYYNGDDLAACLEGKMVYEVIQKINQYPEIKTVYDSMDLFPTITDDMYQMMCKRVEETNYTIDDLRERMR